VSAKRKLSELVASARALMRMLPDPAHAQNNSGDDSDKVGMAWATCVDCKHYHLWPRSSRQTVGMVTFHSRVCLECRCPRFVGVWARPLNLLRKSHDSAQGSKQKRQPKEHA
jgi:hypothetical protein